MIKNVLSLLIVAVLFLSTVVIVAEANSPPVARQKAEKSIIKAEAAFAVDAVICEKATQKREPCAGSQFNDQLKTSYGNSNRDGFQGVEIVPLL